MTIAVVACGAVAMCSIISVRERKLARIFAVDCNSSRLRMAEELECVPVNFKEVDPVVEIKRMTVGNGIIEGVGQAPALRTACEVVRPGGKLSSFGSLHNGGLSFTGLDCYNKDVHIHFGRCPVRLVFRDALGVLVRNRDLVKRMNLIEVVLPWLDESFKDALDCFEPLDRTDLMPDFAV